MQEVQRCLGDHPTGGHAGGSGLDPVHVSPSARRPDPGSRVRGVLRAATCAYAAISLAWLGLWLLLAAHATGLLRHLAQPTSIAFLGLCTAPSLAAAFLVWRAPRCAGRLLVGGGIATAALVWRWHVPAYGGDDALWCMPVVMVSLGSGWLALTSRRS